MQSTWMELIKLLIVILSKSNDSNSNSNTILICLKYKKINFKIKLFNLN